jgi:sialidase-1
LLTRSHGQDDEDSIVGETSRERTRVLVTSSKDDGLTWEPLRDITASAAAPSWRWYGTGPGVGIQLASGRLLIPAYHSDAKPRLYRSHAIYSDDRGKTWKHGESTGEHASESQAVERADGSVHLNARTNDQGPALRTIADSKDGGVSWSKARHDANLFDPHCQASILRLSLAREEDRTRWLFCHPAGPGRHNLTVRLSYDEGKSWPSARKLRDGDSQYSCMARLRDGSIGLLHESWVESNYQIYFVRFSLDWLTGGKDKLPRP